MARVRKAKFAFKETYNRSIEVGNNRKLNDLPSTFGKHRILQLTTLRKVNVHFYAHLYL